MVVEPVTKQCMDDQYPMAAHPAYADRADVIRGNMDHQTIAYAVVDGRSLVQTKLLAVRKAVGPAPYVGQPFCYIWEVATDEHGRSVCGPATIAYLAEWPL